MARRKSCWSRRISWRGPAGRAAPSGHELGTALKACIRHRDRGLCPPRRHSQVIASIEEPEVIARILAHLERTAPQRDRLELPLGARAPPIHAALRWRGTGRVGDQIESSTCVARTAAGLARLPPPVRGRPRWSGDSSIIHRSLGVADWADGLIRGSRPLAQRLRSRRPAFRLLGF
jgi:hypothetical protein